MAQPTRLVTTFAVAALAVSLAACSSSGGGAKTSTTPSTPASSSSTASSSVATTPSPSETVSIADLSKTLLTPADLALTGATSTASTSSEHPLPCDPDTGKSLNQQFPATARAGVDIADDALQAAVSEEIRLFSDVTTAASALGAAKTGLTCATGSVRSDAGALPAQIKAPVDISANLNSDAKLSGNPVTAALVWQATAGGNDLILAVIQEGRSLVLFTFQSPTGADVSKLPAPEAVIQAGLEKIVSS
jgi:hypothetical protein